MYIGATCVLALQRVPDVVHRGHVPDRPLGSMSTTSFGKFEKVLRVGEGRRLKRLHEQAAYIGTLEPDFEKLTEGMAVEVDVIEGPDGYEATCVVPL